MNTEQPSRNQNYGPLCSLECGSLLPPLFVWSCSGSGKAQASLRTPKRTRQECCKNPCQVAKDFRLSSTEASGFSVGGAAVTVLTKSGTNKFHGSAFGLH